MNRKSIIVFVLFFFTFCLLHAEKIQGYVPPPFSYRLLCSIIVLTPLSIFTFLILFFYFKFIDKDANKIKMLKLFVAMLTPLTLACLLSASDAYNDEGWSPISEAILLPFYVPFAIPILGKRLKLWLRIIIGICLFITLFILLGYMELPYHDFMAKTNLPTSW